MILRLLGIEIYKSLSRIGNLIIIFAVIIASFFAVPVIKANEWGHIYEDPKEEIPRAAEEMYREYMQLAEDSQEPQKGYYSACAEAYKTLLDNDIAAGCWQYDRYFDYYFRAMGSLWAFEAAKDPSRIEEIKSIVYNEKHENEYSYYYNILQDVRFDDENNVFLHTGELLENYPYVGYYGEDIAAECGDAESIEPLIDLEREFSEALKQKLIMTTSEYAEMKIQKYTEEKAEQERLSEEYQKDLDNRTREYYLAVKSSAGCDREIECFELLRDCSVEREVWVLMQAEYTEREYLEYLPRNIVMSPNEFEENGRYDKPGEYYGGHRRFDSYDEYLSFAKEREKRILLDMDYNIYTARYKSESDFEISANINCYYPLDCFEKTIKADVFMVMFLCILFACTIMSNEYGSGTARMLLIRPCSRWKILTGKLLCVILFGVAALGLTFVSSCFGILCTFGADSLNPVLIFKTMGEIREVNRILFCIAEGYIYSLPAFAAVIFGLLLSIVSKKALVSAAGSLLPFFFGTALAKSTWDHLVGYPIFKYTLIPYCMTLDELADPYNFSLITETPREYGLYFYPAVVVILVHIAVLTAACYVIFGRQQIKQ